MLIPRSSLNGNSEDLVKHSTSMIFSTESKNMVVKINL